jgi:inosine-uridine nucleoside N-ribohydrolase
VTYLLCALSASLLAIAATSVAGQTPAPSPSHRIILDTDPGTDDAMAILLALNSPELKVEALTVVAGNVTADQALENTLRLVSFAGRCDIPIAAGARKPLVQKLITAEFVHGKNGMANLELPAPKCRADSRFAADLIIEIVKSHPKQITLAPVGPLTNIALAVSKDPSIVPLVKEVVLMGGSITEGNVTGVAEANIYNDPEAAQVVFNAGWPITMVGLDVTHRTLFAQTHLAELQKTRGPLNDFASKVMKFLIELSATFGSTGTPMHDPLAIGVLIDPTLVSAPAMRIDVETRGEFTRGQTAANRHLMVERNELRDGRYVMVGIDKLTPNARVATAVEAERFMKLFIGRLARK